MTEKAKIIDMFYSGAFINIIGDSLSAGAGSSESYKTDEIILRDGNDVFVRRISPNGWCGKFEKHLYD